MVWLRALLAERDGNAAESRAAMTGISTQFDPIPIDALRYRPQAAAARLAGHFGLVEPQKAAFYRRWRKPAGGGVQAAGAGLPAENNQERAVEA